MQPRKIHEETLMCSYKKCCPTVHLYEDGSVELTDDDREAGSVGTIKLKPGAVAHLLEVLTTQQ
jgi:hypothetical protein